MKSKKLFVLVLSMMMVLSMSYSVFANSSDGSGASANTGVKTATAADEAYLVKYLKIADGVTDPQITFSFSFAGQGTDTPAIDTQTIKPATSSQSTDDGGSSLVGSINLSNIFKKDGKSIFTHAGVYTYIVSEAKTVPTGFEDDDEDGVYEKTTETGTGDAITTVTEKLTLSNETYKMEVRIANDPDDTDDGLADPEVSIIKNPTGSDAGKDKVNATDPDPTVTEEPNSSGGGTSEVDHGSESTIPGFSFTNVYQKTEKKPIDPNPEDPTQGQYGAAGITKTVVGAYGDQTYEFPFEIKMTKGAGVADTTATAKVYEGDTATSETYTITFGAEEATSFTLKHGESLIFEELPAGVSYTVSEKLQDSSVKDKTKYMVAFNGTPNGTKGASSLNNPVTVSDAADAENDGHFTNTLDTDDVTPTGIVINNLPYVLLIGLALGGIVLFSRKKRYE